MKKALIVGLASMMAIAFTSGAAMAASCAAAGGIQYCTLAVKRATAKPNGVTALMLEKTDGSGYQWYTAPSGSEDQALAVGLTAISLGSQVRVGLSSLSSTAILEIGLDNGNL